MQKKIDITDHSNIKKEHLCVKKLHLNKKGFEREFLKTNLRIH